MLIFNAVILFSVATRISLHALMLKKLINFLILSGTVFPFWLKHSVLSAIS